MFSPPVAKSQHCARTSATRKGSLDLSRQAARSAWASVADGFSLFFLLSLSDSVPPLTAWPWDNAISRKRPSKTWRLPFQASAPSRRQGKSHRCSRGEVRSRRQILQQDPAFFVSAMGVGPPPPHPSRPSSSGSPQKCYPRPQGKNFPRSLSFPAENQKKCQLQPTTHPPHVQSERDPCGGLFFLVCLVVLGRGVGKNKVPAYGPPVEEQHRGTRHDDGCVSQPHLHRIASGACSGGSHGCGLERVGMLRN